MAESIDHISREYRLVQRFSVSSVKWFAILELELYY